MAIEFLVAAVFAVCGLAVIGVVVAVVVSRTAGRRRADPSDDTRRDRLQTRMAADQRDMTATGLAAGVVLGAGTFESPRLDQQPHGQQPQGDPSFGGGSVGFGFDGGGSAGDGGGGF